MSENLANKVVNYESLDRYNTNMMEVVDSVAVLQNTVPSGKHTRLWATKSETDVSIPQIMDSLINTTDTWSSNKISAEFDAVKNNVMTFDDVDALFT